MAKVNKEALARLEGMKFAYNYAKKFGIEALEKEVEFRGATKLPYSVDRKQVIAFQNEMKNNILSTVMLMSVLVLKEKFNFTDEEIEMFSDKFKDNTEQLESGDLTWRDTYEAMVEEVGFSLRVDDDILDLKVNKE